MGRRRQHNGGLALASDQIPGLAQHNIHSGLVTFSAGFARPFANQLWLCYSKQTEKGKFGGQTGSLVRSINRPRWVESGRWENRGNLKSPPVTYFCRLAVFSSCISFYTP